MEGFKKLQIKAFEHYKKNQFSEARQLFSLSLEHCQNEFDECSTHIYIMVNSALLKDALNFDVSRTRAEALLKAAFDEKRYQEYIILLCVYTEGFCEIYVFEKRYKEAKSIIDSFEQQLALYSRYVPDIIVSGSKSKMKPYKDGLRSLGYT